jgi:hypothetical protein
MGVSEMDGTSSVKFKGSKLAMQGTENGVTNIELFPWAIC